MRLCKVVFLQPSGSGQLMNELVLPSLSTREESVLIIL